MGNYLVTGGTGQIGTFLCEELLSEGHNVVVYDFKPNMENLGPMAKKVTVVASDVTDMSELLNVIKQNSIDYIVHLAALVLFDSMQHPAKAYQVNIVGTNNILEAARILDVGKVVFASSVSVYGMPKTRRQGIADEEDYPNTPFDPYSTTKIADELMGRYYRETYGLDLNAMRITAAWGPGRYWGYTGQFNDFIRKVAVGEDAIFPDDFSYRGEKLRWMYVKDVGFCFAHTAQAPRTKSYLFNLGSRSPFNAKDVISMLKTIVPERRMEIKERDTPSKVSATVAGPNGLDVDCSRLYDELGFEPRFTLAGALRDMINFERARMKLPLV
jgi:UDP-glucose 4-epimerase